MRTSSSPSPSSSLLVRAPVPEDYAGWKPLWDGYNAFYEREGPTALPEEITRVTWQRFFDAYEPVHALVAERDGRLVGLTHYLFHRSTTRIEPNCYLQDLFTLPSERGRGVGRQLIEGVYAHVKRVGAHRVYWQTHVTNTAGRMLYDKMASHDGFIVYGTLV
ncbi:GNAT family N-acetyltransferase [Variovorax sp. CCNWLW225]|uniref:GNAT family N-acetyltransferase n=1 Tax=Variovorax sp. CCNWLW225 TaxID=3127462 RepID=UPI0030780D51